MANGKSTIRNGAPGHGLAELMIVLACAVILISTGAPNILKLRQEWTLWGGARLLESFLQWGRMQAIAANAVLVFRIQDNGKKFFWTDALTGVPYQGSVRYLPSNVRIISYPKLPLRFYQQGNAAPAGTFTVEGIAGSYSVVVTPGGRIRIQRN